MGKAGAQIEITASSSRLVSGLNAAYSKFMSFGGSVARGMGRAFKAINAKLEPGATAKNALAHAGGDLIGKGLGMLTDAAGDVRDFNRDLTRFGITAGRTPAQVDELGKSLRRTSVATGINSNEIVKAAGTYFDLTSDAAGTATALNTFSRVAQATGGDMDSIVRTAAAMGDNMGIASTEFESAFSGLIEQGKAGKVTMSELAREAPSLMAMYSQFGKGTGRQGLMEMNAAFQVGAKAFGSASQAATGLEAMMGMLKARQAQLAAAGVKVYKVNKDGTVTMRGLHDIVADIAKAKIDPRKFGKIFGENKEGRNFLEKLMAMPKLYEEIVAAGADAGAVQRDGMAYAESSAGRLDAALNRVKETIATAFTPERITAFVNAVESLADKLGPVVDAVGWVADKLGSIAGVGKSIRGALSGNANNNPWQATRISDSYELDSNSDIDMRTGKYRSTTERAGARTAATLRSANRDAYDKAVDDIMGAEVGERTSKDSIRKAYFAAASDPSAAGGLGQQRAGSRYLEAAGMSKQQAGEQITKEMIEQLNKNNADLIAAIKGSSPTFKLGNEMVERAANNSAEARRNP